MGKIKNRIYKSASTSELSQKLIPLMVIGTLLQTGSGLRAEEAKPWGQINQYLRFTGEFSGSYEIWNYFQPNAKINNNNDYDLWSLRARLGLELTTSFVDVYAQAQYNGLYGLPDNAVAAPPVGALGLGGAYYFANQTTDASNVFLKQAFLNFKGNSLGLTGAQLKVGRYEYKDGLEYQSGDVKFDAIKSKRVAQRLLGSNVVHVGRSFDGFSAVYDQPAFNITASGLRPTQGGFTVQGQDDISKINLFYTALTAKKNALLPGTEARLFHLYYKDDRNAQVVDNRPVLKRPNLDRQDLTLHTVGTHLLTLQPVGSGSIDGLLWGAYQFGDWTNLDQQAWAIDAEAGYQWNKIPLKPWLRAIYYRSSGDNNPNDGIHRTFFTALPSPRTYAKFPYYNMMNLQDAFVQMIVSPTEKIKVAIDFHHLQLADANDLFYSGPGATSRSGSFGYAGRPSGGSSDIGQLIDINFTHNLTREFSWTIYYGHAFGGNVIDNVYPKQKNADTAHIDFNLVF